MSSVNKPQHPPSPARATSPDLPDLSSPRSLAVLPARVLTPPSMPVRGQIWVAQFGQRDGVPLQVLVMNSGGARSSPWRTVLHLQSCEPGFGGHDTRFAIPPAPRTGLQQLVAVDTQVSRSMQVQYLTLYVGRVPAELMDDISSSLGLVLECI